MSNVHVVPEIDVEAWVNSKDEPWRLERISTKLTSAVLNAAIKRGRMLEPQAKVKLLVALAAAPDRDRRELAKEIAELVDASRSDDDEWVRVISDVLTPFSRGTDALNPRPDSAAFRAAVSALGTLAGPPGAHAPAPELVPLEAAFLVPSDMEQVVTQQQQHFVPKDVPRPGVSAPAPARRDSVAPSFSRTPRDPHAQPQMERKLPTIQAPRPASSVRMPHRPQHRMRMIDIEEVKGLEGREHAPISGRGVAQEAPAPAAEKATDKAAAEKAEKEKADKTAQPTTQPAPGLASPPGPQASPGTVLLKQSGSHKRVREGDTDTASPKRAAHHDGGPGAKKQARTPRSGAAESPMVVVPLQSTPPVLPLSLAGTTPASPAIGPAGPNGTPSGPPKASLMLAMAFKQHHQQPVQFSPSHIHHAHAAATPPNAVAPTQAPGSAPPVQLSPAQMTLSQLRLDPANMLTQEGREAIERFLAGHRDPQPAGATIRQIPVHSENRTLEDGTVVCEQIVFEMNYEKGAWKKLRKRTRVDATNAAASAGK